MSVLTKQATTRRRLAVCGAEGFRAAHERFQVQSNRLLSMLVCAPTGRICRGRLSMVEEALAVIEGEATVIASRIEIRHCTRMDAVQVGGEYAAVE